MSIPKNKNFSDYDNYKNESNPTTAAQGQEFFRNQADLLKAVVDSGYWQPETNYALGDVVLSPAFSKSAEAVCTKAGKSSLSEPSWGAIGGGNITDGTVVWQLRHKRWEQDVATQAEAEAGTDNTKPMTPLRTKQAVEKFTPNLNEAKGVLPVAKGGTGATTAKVACINLGICNESGHLVLPDGSEFWIA